LKHQISIAKTT